VLIVYSRPGCLFCKQVEELFTENGIRHKTVLITELDRQNELAASAGAKSFPLVFRDDKFVGGFTHVVHLHALGRLKELEATGPQRSPAQAAVAPKSSATPDPRPAPKVVSTARDEIAAFAKWGEHLKAKRTAT